MVCGWVDLKMDTEKTRVRKRMDNAKISYMGESIRPFNEKENLHCDNEEEGVHLRSK